MTRETLEDRLAAARSRLQVLEQAKVRKDRGEACLTLAEHVTDVLQVVAGGLTEAIWTKLGFSYSFGYEIHRCLACGAFLIAKYDGERMAVIPESTADILVNRPMEFSKEGI